jgi:hypothetical protein
MCFSTPLWTSGGMVLRPAPSEAEGCCRAMVVATLHQPTVLNIPAEMGNAILCNGHIAAVSSAVTIGLNLTLGVCAAITPQIGCHGPVDAALSPRTRAMLCSRKRGVILAQVLTDIPWRLWVCAEATTLLPSAPPEAAGNSPGHKSCAVAVVAVSPARGGRQWPRSKSCAVAVVAVSPARGGR